MKTKAFKTTIAAGATALLFAACNPSGGSTDQTTRQMGDTSITGTANTQIDGTDTMMTDTSATSDTPGGGAGSGGIGTGQDSLNTPGR